MDAREQGVGHLSFLRQVTSLCSPVLGWAVPLGSGPQYTDRTKSAGPGRIACSQGTVALVAAPSPAGAVLAARNASQSRDPLHADAPTPTGLAFRIRHASTGDSTPSAACPQAGIWCRDAHGAHAFCEPASVALCHTVEPPAKRRPPGPCRTADPNRKPIRCFADPAGQANGSSPKKGEGQQ